MPKRNSWQTELWVLSGKQAEIEDADWHTDVVTKKDQE